MRWCAPCAVIVAGCSSLEYPRISGADYYSWLASSYSPVIQSHERRRGGEGVCLQLDGGKVQLRGFVTLDDISAAAQTHSDLSMRAQVYQMAFSDGMAKGMSDGFRGKSLTADEKARLRLELDAPPEFKSHVSEWRAGWSNGYSYGEHFSRRMK